jgi:2,3-bisphosphoglycerate-independent phosphoglycerate mutase
MVGHTANKPAIIRAVEIVDRELKRVVDEVISKGGVAIVTADHGNAEQNVDESGELHTAHTLNLVPFIIASTNLTIQIRQLAEKNPLSSHKYELRDPSARSDKSELSRDDNSGYGSLADIAPTVLELLKIKKPVSMTGEGLIIE